ncbi:hypothetical protein BDN70DRAFT_932610 [Pholiota conissans]|uniref:Uncharacterized protein n=1 Tax=Pholiota conissans TaxID=109636 RepID=A0A9P5Z0V9_9AGAR|nr:hypothetical protein BDN70DRAFT_932610 [Pholiota conissans]
MALFVQRLKRRSSVAHGHYPSQLNGQDVRTDAFLEGGASDGEDCVYLATGTTCHQDLYPRKHQRLVISRPKKKLRRDSGTPSPTMERQKIQWPDASNTQELSIFSEQQLRDGSLSPTWHTNLSVASASSNFPMQEEGDNPHRPLRPRTRSLSSSLAFKQPKMSPDLALMVIRRPRVTSMRNISRNTVKGFH